jgi:hypothetical protein
VAKRKNWRRGGGAREFFSKLEGIMRKFLNVRR